MVDTAAARSLDDASGLLRRGVQRKLIRVGRSRCNPSRRLEFHVCNTSSLSVVLALLARIVVDPWRTHGALSGRPPSSARL